MDLTKYCQNCLIDVYINSCENCSIDICLKCSGRCSKCQKQFCLWCVDDICSVLEVVKYGQVQSSILCYLDIRPLVGEYFTTSFVIYVCCK